MTRMDKNKKNGPGAWACRMAAGAGTGFVRAVTTVGLGLRK